MGLSYISLRTGWEFFSAIWGSYLETLWRLPWGQGILVRLTSDLNTVLTFWPLGTLCRPPLVPPCTFHSGVFTGILKPRPKGQWVLTGWQATCTQFWHLDLVGTGLATPLVGPHLFLCHFGILLGPWDHCLRGQGYWSGWRATCMPFNILSENKYSFLYL